jgi:hypothetical protein
MPTNMRLILKFDNNPVLLRIASSGSIYRRLISSIARKAAIKLASISAQFISARWSEAAVRVNHFNPNLIAAC